MKCFEEYFGDLERLSIQRLDQSAEKLIASEKECVAQVIAHLAEMSRRKAHLELGYKNLFDYCTKHLGLSEGSTYLRIHVAKVGRRFPEVLESLARNEVNLSVAGRLAPHLTAENVNELLGQARAKPSGRSRSYW